MATTFSAPTERPALRSNNRRRGWVIASEDGSEVERPTSFDPRRSAAAWNKGNGPSKASIPSRASSLASPAASPTIPSAALQSAPIETPSTSSTTTVETRPSPTAKKPPTLRGDMALLAAQRRSNSSSGSSAVTMSSSAAQSTITPATSAASTPLMAMQNNGKEKALARSTLQDDDQEFFSSSGPGSSSSDASSNATMARPSSQQSHVDRATPKTSLLFSPNQLPPLSENSANPDLEDALTSTSKHASDSEATISTHAKPGKKHDSVSIELPPPPAQFKDRYPPIMVDSTHASDSEANGASNSGQRRRRRRSTASNSNKLGAEGEDDEDDYADDNSSWPSTPSTTTLEAYFAAADAGTRPHRKTVQTTKEIVAPASNSIGMDRPMVVVTSPSTASEVSSDRHSSSGSGSTSDRVSSSSPPAAPVLSKIEEHPAAKAATSKAEASSSAPPRRSLSFELPAVPRTRASEENLPIATPVRSPSRTMAFLAKINLTRTSNNRSSADLASSGRPEESVAAVEQAKRMSLDGQKRTSSEQRRSVELRPILLNAASRPPSRPVGAAAESDTTGQAPAKPIATSQEKQQRRRSSGLVPIRPNVVPYHSRRSSEISVGSSNVSPLVQDRGSFDEEASDSRYSPSSQETALTMPSPAMSTDAKPFSAQPARTPDRRSSTAGAKKDRFAASMPSLHQQQSSQERMVSRQTPSHEQAAGNRPSAIGLLVDSQKGRMLRDNESIAEWISVSVNDLPLPAETQTYRNGGAGEFSNKKEEAKKARKNKPWKFGRFAASEVVLPAKNTSASPISPSSGALVLPKRRSISFAKRASTAQVNNASRASADSVPAPQSGSFMRNLGFTTANRNVVLQSMCAERSVSALAASTIYIAGCGRINVPQPGPKPDGKIKSKAKSKAQDAAEKRQSQRSSKAASMPVPVEEVASDLVSPCYSAEASHDA
ncbi:hypothetical protein NDA13_002724 [Ustilago tritici]|nr:hypothetical protein NDA13_002724 [Ustilago tritici]